MSLPLDVSSWPALESSLAAHLHELAPDEFVTLAAPVAGRPSPRRGLVGALDALLRRVPGPVVPLVQAKRMDDVLYAECLGSTSFGGDYPWTPHEEEQLRDAGWSVPEHHLGARVFVGWYPEQPGPVMFPDPALAAVAATRMVRPLRDVLGVPSPAGLEVTGGR